MKVSRYLSDAIATRDDRNANVCTSLDNFGKNGKHLLQDIGNIGIRSNV